MREQLQFSTRAIEQALADGYSGLRVAGRSNELAGAPLQWSGRPGHGGSGLATLCAYRVRPAEELPFRLSVAADALLLAGEVDAFCADRLAARLPAVEPVRVLDVAGLTFVDAAGAGALSRWLEQQPVPPALRGATRALRRVWAVLQLPPVRLA